MGRWRETWRREEERDMQWGKDVDRESHWWRVGKEREVEGVGPQY